MDLTREQLEELLEHSPDIIIATNRKGRVIYYNDGAHDILGYESEEVLGEFVGVFYPSVDEARRIGDAIRSGEHGEVGVVSTFETTFVARSGEEIPVAITATLLHDEKGDEDGTIGFAKDLRAIRRQDQLATLGEVAIGLSHEINNPLAVIVNQATLLENDIAKLACELDCSVENERLDAIRREVARISEIVDRLGEMVKADSYETIHYVGPAKMVDLRSPERKRYEPDPRLRGLRILVADDDQGISQTLQEMLEADGCEVEVAGDGAEALEKLASGAFDLVLSDVVMPKMDGYALYRKVRELYPDLPVLMMTAFHYDKDHIIKRSRMEGLEGVIFKKPVDPDRLRRTIVESVRPER
ncbi:MAG: response regulator [Spirochaetaceae bacterium]|nr:response regulator [Myxococcales bacterium]MCB9724042.1 response regulator [Spirochaetaceae bacterium]HPG26902.1 response regulator [Myxococcota bacterium]